MGDRRSWMFKGAAGVGFLLVLLLGIAVYKMDRLYRVLVADLCSVTVHRLVPAPDAKMVLVTFEADCGATTPFNTQVSLLPGGAEFSRDIYPPFFVARGRHDLVVNWTNNSEIEIEVPRNEQIFRQESRANGIAVTYR